MRAALDKYIRSPKARAESSVRLKEQQRRRLAWCPDDQLTEYRRLRKSRKSASIARAIIESRMTPFEKQLAKVRCGASITELPRMRAAEPTVSYAGSSLA
jgi:phage FluMu gp28-like protein